MKIVIMRAMRGEFPSMDVYADGLAAGLRAAYPDWEVVEIEPVVRFNTCLTSRLGRAINGLRRYLDRFWLYPREAARQQADIVHVMSDHHFQVARFLRGSKTRVVATCHDLIYYRKRDNIEQFAKFVGISRRAQEYCMESLRFCDEVITLSQDNVRDLQGILGIAPERITVIHNAVAAHFQPPQPGGREKAREEFGFPEGRFCIMHVGTVEPRKNVDSILRALVELQPLGVTFVKVGMPFTPDQERFIQEHRLQGGILHLGKRQNEDMTRICHASDALIFPSLYEGFPFPIGEAMASDLPVITSTASSLPEVAGGAAILVDPLDIGQIVQAVRDLQASPQLRTELIQKGRKRVARLTWIENAREVAAVYEKARSVSKK